MSIEEVVRNARSKNKKFYAEAGDILINGRGIERDIKEGTKFLKKAIKNNESNAIISLAKFYAENKDPKFHKLYELGKDKKIKDIYNAGTIFYNKLNNYEGLAECYYNLLDKENITTYRDFLYYLKHIELSKRKLMPILEFCIENDMKDAYLPYAELLVKKKKVKEAVELLNTLPDEEYYDDALKYKFQIMFNEKYAKYVDISPYLPSRFLKEYYDNNKRKAPRKFPQGSVYSTNNHIKASTLITELITQYKSSPKYKKDFVNTISSDHFSVTPILDFIPRYEYDVTLGVKEEYTETELKAFDSHQDVSVYDSSDEYVGEVSVYKPIVKNVEVTKIRNLIERKSGNTVYNDVNASFISNENEFLRNIQSGTLEAEINIEEDHNIDINLIKDLEKGHVYNWHIYGYQFKYIKPSWLIKVRYQVDIAYKSKTYTMIFDGEKPDYGKLKGPKKLF